MTDALVAEIIKAIVPAAASITAAVFAIVSLKKSRENGVKADTLIIKTEEIHQLTNSRLAKVTADLAAITALAAGMKEHIDSLTAAKIVADSVAQKLAETRKEP